MIRRTRHGKHRAGTNGTKLTTYIAPCTVTWRSACDLTVRVGEGDGQWTLRLWTNAAPPVNYTPSREKKIKYYGPVKKVVTTDSPWYIQLGLDGEHLPPSIREAVARPTLEMEHRALGMRPLPFAHAPPPLTPPAGRVIFEDSSSSAKSSILLPIVLG